MAIDLFLPSPASLLHDADLLPRQPIQLIHQRVDLLVGGLDLALAEIVIVRGWPRCFRSDPATPECAPSTRLVAGPATKALCLLIHAKDPVTVQPEYLR